VLQRELGANYGRTEHDLEEGGVAYPPALGTSGSAP
jgi:hypothetical protein